MEFGEVLTQVLHLLKCERRVSYRALKRRFNLDDDYIEDLKDELIEAKQCAVDEHGRVLVWTGFPESAAPSAPATNEDMGSGPCPPEHLAAHVPTPSLSQQATRQDAPFVPPLSASHPPDAERRQLTVMFCDLVGSTSLAGQLDPEDFREVVQAYQTASAEIIQHFDGHIAQYLGDGVLVYYGYPRAHEEDAQRAVRTGLGIVEAIEMLNTRLERAYGIRLAVHIGIHTGLVVVGEMGGGDRHEQLALGETPNIAARILGLAAPDTVVISDATYRLTQGYFMWQNLGRNTLRGVTEPVHVYRAIQETGAQSRFDVAVTTGLTTLVGREEELRLLWRCWEQSREGLGQVVVLSGEAGIGKSRLVEALRERVGPENCTRMAFQCSPFHTHSAFYAVINYLQCFMQWRHDDAPIEKLAKLEAMLQRSHCPMQEVIPLFANLLSIPLPDEHYPPLTLSPQQQKQQIQRALVAWLLEEAERQPVLAVWEDLHWADPSTLELLSLAVDSASTTRIMIILIFRPEFHPPWPTRPHLTPLTLSRLERSRIEAMVASITDGKTLPPEVLEQVIAKTDGVPLFVEELLKMVIESGFVQEEDDRYVLTGSLSSLSIPATLQDSLMARLDQHTAGKEVAQLGATLGREFTYEVLQAIMLVDEMRSQQGLAQLVEAELVYQQGVPPRSTYIFKHALIQDAAYQSLLRRTRQQYHQQIAQVLEGQFSETVSTQPELLAHHYTEAGLYEQAIPYWQQAGQLAIERSANIEAIRHLTKGLEMLETLPETSERVQQELRLQLTLGAPLTMMKGTTAPEVEYVYARVQELCQQVEDSSQHFLELAGLRRFYFSQGQLRAAHELGEQCFALAQRMGDPELLREVHLMLGSTWFFLGEPVLACEHLERGIALYDSQHSHSLLFSRGTNPGVECLARKAWALWMLGYPDRALSTSYEALTLAQESSHAYSLSFALCHVAVIHTWRREVRSVLEQSDTLIAFSSEHGFVLWVGGGMCTRGWALTEQGSAEEGIEHLSQGLATRRNRLGLTHNLAMLAEAYGKAGQCEVGLRVLAESLDTMHRNAERHYEAELYRLKGELLLQEDRKLNVEAAEASFLHAISVAHHQQAKSWELRAVISLCRLWQQQDRRAEAHQMLEGIYGWFTEGFDTPDFREAQALLGALA